MDKQKKNSVRHEIHVGKKGIIKKPRNLKRNTEAMKKSPLMASSPPNDLNSKWYREKNGLQNQIEVRGHNITFLNSIILNFQIQFIFSARG